MARKPLPEEEPISKEWLASYADAMTLLLAFFIMMFAFALIDEGKYFDFKVGVMAALGVPDPLTDNTDSILAKGTGISPEVGLTPTPASEEVKEAVEELRKVLADAGVVTPDNAEALRDLLAYRFAVLGAADLVEVGVDERGVYVRFDGRVLFASGEAELDDDGLTLLATAADVLAIVENRLEIEGHTDSQPTGTGWPSNWELSSARAARVVRWLIETGEIPAPQLVAMGLADTRPRAENTSEEGRQRNRRVEIVIRVDGMVESDVPVIDPLGGDPIDLDGPIVIDGLGSSGTDESESEAGVPSIEAEVRPDPVFPLSDQTNSGGPDG